jgi:hypothetical protein
MTEPASPKTALLQVRMPPDLKARLEKHVERINDLAFEQGFPPSATVSDLVRMWIEEKLDAPAPQKTAHKGVDQAVKPADNVLTAFEKLRGQ